MSETAQSTLAGGVGSYLVGASQGRHIHSLAADRTGTTDSGRVFTGTRVDDGINKDLERVLHRVEYIYNERLMRASTTRKRAGGRNITYLAGEEMDNLKSVLDNADSHELLSVVTSVHHHAVHKTLHNGALGLAETAHGISASSVGKVHGMAVLDGNVVAEGNVVDLDIVTRPLSKDLHLWDIDLSGRELGCSLDSLNLGHDDLTKEQRMKWKLVSPVTYASTHGSRAHTHTETHSTLSFSSDCVSRWRPLTG